MKANENVSKYVSDGLQFAASLVTPTTGQPIVALLTNIVQTPIAADLRAQVNDAFSQNTNLTSNLVDLTFEPNPVTRKDTTYHIIARPVSFWTGKLTDDPPIDLGTLNVSNEREATLIGVNRPGDLPNYLALDNTTSISTVVEDAGGNKQVEYNRLAYIANQPPTLAVDGVRTLAQGAQPQDVSKACDALRDVLNRLGLNQLDTAAYLWRVFTWSDYAAHHQTSTAQGACITGPEFDLVKSLDLMQWLQPSRFARPVSVPSPGVPNFKVPEKAVSEHRG